jgi:hypothetical protein
MQRKTKKAEKIPSAPLRRRSSFRALLRQAKAEGWPEVEIDDGGRKVRFRRSDQATSADINPWDRALSDAENKKRST